MTEKDAIFFLNHIVESIQNIEEFSENIDKEDLEEDKLRKSAIVRQIEIIGEAAKNIPLEFTKKYPKIPWNEMARMRDKLIHHYFGVDFNIVWKVMTEDLPILKKDISKIIDMENKKK